MDDQMLKVIDDLEEHPQIYWRIPMQCVLDEGTSKDLGITGSIDCEAYLLYSFRPELLSLPHLSSYENSPEYVIAPRVLHF